MDQYNMNGQPQSSPSVVVETKQETLVSKKDKLCDFYVSARGCVKGDECDFSHPVAPSGTVTNRICDFFLKSRGCNKENECNFLHVENLPSRAHSARAKNTVMKMCEFYLSQKGCVKGLQCDFLHPVQPGAPGTMRQFMMQAATAKICSFYHSPRGCVKGLECDFLHVTEANRQQWAQGMAIMSNAAAGANSRMFNNHQSMGGSGDYPIKKKAQICQFIGTARGCVKGDLCDFIHKKERPCDFHLTPRGCRKGDFCDFQHSDSPADSAEGASTPSQGQQRDTAVAQQMPAVAQQIPVNHYR